ncbi:aminotransferase [Pelotalea chapellei]|uniref:Aminotransferase n=1 Tax=Pelotalea chapellei TaxID=44671 RepID=A0ABS5U8V2_9BACT|nr:aminotransferase [Pelotalea chapellei]MBT1072068.1 aminotransferase [Pelotalea chapellei]
MPYHINDHLRSVNFPPISEVKEWLAARPEEGPELIDLCQAVPDYAPAPELINHLKVLLDEPTTSRYTPDEGLPEVRRAVCDRYKRRYAAKMEPNQLCLTAGASQAFWLAIMTLCHAGDEVILQAPCYFDHPMALESLRIKPVFAPFDEERKGLPDPAVINRLITPRTRAILLVTPSNPTGASIPPALLTELYLLARKHRIALVLDETYADFVASQPHELFTIPDWHSTLVQIMSFGKTYALTGYRAGLLAASDEMIRQALKIQDSMVVCQPRITQMALKYGVENLDDWVDANRLLMDFRHSLFVHAFTQPGNHFRLVASGSFFAWVRHPFSRLTGRQAAKKMLDEAGILCLGGEVFGPGLEGYLRLALGNISKEIIPEAARRFRSIPI